MIDSKVKAFIAHEIEKVKAELGSIDVDEFLKELKKHVFSNTGGTLEEEIIQAEITSNTVSNLLQDIDRFIEQHNKDLEEIREDIKKLHEMIGGIDARLEITEKWIKEIEEK